MRLQIIIKSSGLVSFDHQPLLVGVINKWLGQNDLHGKLSFLSFGRLENGKKISNKLYFETTSFFISSHDENVISKIIDGIKKDPKMFQGLEVYKYYIEDDPDFSNKSIFFVSSPIFIKRKNDEGNVDHILYDNEKAGIYLKETILNKMEKCNFPIDDTLDIKFDLSYKKPTTQLVKYRVTNNRSNICPVIIKGKDETKKFIWNVGLGNSTGIGFGAIKL